jgi:hypothetical protein
LLNRITQKGGLLWRQVALHPLGNDLVQSLLLGPLLSNRGNLRQ